MQYIVYSLVGKGLSRLTGRISTLTCRKVFSGFGLDGGGTGRFGVGYSFVVSPVPEFDRRELPTSRE